jgi:hypothetical protein
MRDRGARVCHNALNQGVRRALQVVQYDKSTARFEPIFKAF